VGFGAGVGGSNSTSSGPTGAGFGADTGGGALAHETSSGHASSKKRR